MAKGFGGGMNMNMVKQVQKLQQDMMRTQQELEERVYEAAAGGGAVIARVTGKHELTAIEISPDSEVLEDVEMLQDLILTAVNGAISKASEEMSENMKRFTGGMNIPGF